MTDIEVGDPFVCDFCGEEFLSGNTSAEAAHEYAENFPAEAARDDEKSIVCDPCYTKIMMGFTSK